jgi:hypothetical protein
MGLAFGRVYGRSVTSTTRWLGAWVALATGCAAAAPTVRAEPVLVADPVDTTLAAVESLRSLEGDAEATAMLDVPRGEHARALELLERWPGDEAVRAELQLRLRRAVDGYRAFLVAYPETTWTYEVQYRLGVALLELGEVEEALSLLTLVRDASFSDARLADAAKGVVRCADALAHWAEERGDFVTPTAPPTPSGEPARVVPIPLPPPVALLLEARDIYVARVDAAPDSDEGYWRSRYLQDNARLAYLYGHWDRARGGFETYYRGECTTPEIGDDLVEAWTALRSIAVVAGDTDAVAGLDVERAERRCRFPVEPPIYPDTSYYSEREEAIHPWRRARGERALRAEAEGVRCDEAGGTYGDWFGASIAASARPREVRVVLENVPYNCGHEPVIAARLHPDGGIELGFGDPGRVPQARCLCAYDLVVTVFGVPAGEHQVAMQSLHTQVSVPSR